MDVTREQEERYLQMLRRVALGLAKTLLVLVALALFAAAYQGASGAYHWTDSRRSRLPSQAERLRAVTPPPTLQTQPMHQMKEKQEALAAMAVAFVSATGFLWNAAQLFGAFLALMFLFLFIKYELHLRDMNNSLSSKSNHA